MYPEEWLQKELEELKRRTIEGEKVFFYYISDLIKENGTWKIVDHQFNSQLSSVNGDYPKTSKKQIPAETEDYMKRLYDFSCRIHGYDPLKDIEEIISDTHIRRKIIDYVDRRKGLKLHINKAII